MAQETTETHVVDNMEELYGLCSIPRPNHVTPFEAIKPLCRLDNGRQFDNPSSTLGLFDKLPLEILHMAFVQLDIQTLTEFRRVNKLARLIIDSIPEYKRIILNAPDTIRASLSIGCARWISCEDLYRTLCTTACSTCRDLGSYLYLLTCRRVCYFCFTKEPEFLPLLRADVMRKFGLKPKHISNLPSLRSLPAKYTHRKLHRYRRVVLIDHDSALKAGLAVHGSLSAMERYTSEEFRTRLEKYKARKAFYDHTLGHMPKPRQPKSEYSVDQADYDPRRFMGVVRAPYLDACTGSPSWGYYCIACRGSTFTQNDMHYWTLDFSKESLEAHIRKRGQVAHVFRLYWHLAP